MLDISKIWKNISCLHCKMIELGSKQNFRKQSLFSYERVNRKLFIFTVQYL